VNSRFTLERFREFHGELDKAHLCWLATEEDEPPGEYCDPDGPPTVLILGRIDHGLGYKGHRELVNCWPEVISAVPQARLLIAGGGPGLDQLKSLVGRSPAQSAIEIRGFVPETELDGLWGEAHVFAMPSKGEGFGLVYAEAMLRSLPVIASVHDAGQEINLDGVTGYNVDLTEPGRLASRLIELLRNKETARKLGRAGHSRWQENFRFGSFARRLLGILEMA
jgi:phosphatidylinositol alpha-1,6-mannosyltransferase